MLIYPLYNSYHLGDNIFNFILFYNLKSYIESHDIFIDYYCRPCYINQVAEFNCSRNIRIKNYEEGVPDYAIELWQNAGIIGFTFDNFYQKAKQNNCQRINYNLYYKLFFNKFLKKVKIPVRLNVLSYADNDLIGRFDRLDQKYKQIDLLVINSQPFSGQYAYNKDIWDGMIRVYQNHFRLVTTTKVDGVLCTMDDNLTVKDIAALSTRVKVIIAVNSGVVPGLLNEFTLRNVKQVYTFDDRCFFSFTNFTIKDDIRQISVSDLEKYMYKKN